MATNHRTQGHGIFDAQSWLCRTLWLSLAIACSLALCWFAASGKRRGPFGPGPRPPLTTVAVDQGDVALVVTETGVLESSVDDLVRCRVESFLRLPVGAPRAGALPQSSQPKASKAGGITGASASRSKETSIDAVAKAVASAKSKLAGGPGPAAGASLTAKRAGSSTGGGSPSFGSSSNASADSGSSTGPSRPLIRSFEYAVKPHVPFRSTLPDEGAMPTTAPPPLTIISILPEGSKVKAGDVVCELDSSLLRDALAVQQLRYVQAQAWVEQAKYSLEADKIALREYESGVLPQDIALVRQNVGICQIEKEQAARNLAWARRALAKGFRTEAQVNADAAVVEQTEIALRDAEGMLTQLVKYTGRRIIKSCKARIQAIQAELLSLEASFRLEQQRLKRIETMIANCKMRAPRDGTIVYADHPNGSGTIDTQIREGLIVHPSQPIFRLLDPHHIQVRARINESQVARIRPGQPVLIHLEAFPERPPLLGSVAEIVPIPSSSNGLFSGVHTFFAKVRIDSGAFDALTTGLSAELEFLVESRRHVTRVPLEAVRWIDDRPFAATVSGPATDLDWQWRPIALGATDTGFAEVVSGLKPGDRVITHSESLPATDLDGPDPETKVDRALGGRLSSR
jgi:HlyD family secretion protein